MENAIKKFHIIFLVLPLCLFRNTFNHSLLYLFANFFLVHLQYFFWYNSIILFFVLCQEEKLALFGDHPGVGSTKHRIYPRVQKFRNL